MAHIFKYTILQAVPDLRRGERVNIGIAVFLPERVDARFSDLSKIKAIATESWDSYVEEAKARLLAAHMKGAEPEHIIGRFSSVERGIECSELGWISVVDPSQYEARLSEVLRDLVSRPRKAPKPKATRINTEIASEFRRVKVLAGKEETIEDNKIVRDFYVSQPEDLRADFALKNGQYHVAATLDLRLANVNISQAALKAVVLDKAGDEFGNNGGVRRIGVYAANGSVEKYNHHILLLKDYADVTYNWLVPRERRAFTKSMYDAMSMGGTLI